MHYKVNKQRKAFKKDISKELNLWRGIQQDARIGAFQDMLLARIGSI